MFIRVSDVSPLICNCICLQLTVSLLALSVQFPSKRVFDASLQARANKMPSVGGKPPKIEEADVIPNVEDRKTVLKLAPKDVPAVIKDIMTKIMSSNSKGAAKGSKAQSEKKRVPLRYAAIDVTIRTSVRVEPLQVLDLPVL